MSVAVSTYFVDCHQKGAPMKRLRISLLFVLACICTISAGTPADAASADINDVDKVPLIGANCKERYKEWISKPSNRAFVINARSSRCHWVTGERDINTAIESAVERCQKQAQPGDKCFVYAQNDKVVWGGNVTQSTAVAQSSPTPAVANEARPKEATAKADEDRKQEAQAKPVEESKSPIQLGDMLNTLKGVFANATQEMNPPQTGTQPQQQKPQPQPTPQPQTQPQSQVQAQQSTKPNSQTALKDAYDKGIKVAKDAGVKWQLFENTDEMTGAKSVFAGLEFKSSGGAVVQAKVSCDNAPRIAVTRPTIELEVTVDKGEVSTQCNRLQCAASGRSRINGAVSSFTWWRSAKFRNVFTTRDRTSIYEGEELTVDNAVMTQKNARDERILVYDAMFELPTNMGDIIIKMPPYESAINAVVKSCK